MKKMLMGLVMILISFVLFANPIVSPDNFYSVSAEADGLHIKKLGKGNYNGINAIVKSGKNENVTMQLDLNRKEWVYPFVEANTSYTVYLNLIDSNWQAHPTKEVVVTATGGLGNLYVPFPSTYFDSDKKEIVLNDYNIISPVKLSSGTYSGTIWYGTDRDNIFSGPNVWGAQYPFKNNRIKISQFAGNIKNKSFLATIEYNFLYKGNKYFAQIVGPENGYYKYSPKDKSYTTERLDGETEKKEIVSVKEETPEVVQENKAEIKSESSKAIQEKEEVNPEKLLEKEREKNQELGLGYFSDEEVAQQKMNNLQLGKGEITDAQYDAECERNENAGEGRFSDYELEQQKLNNLKLGKGNVTDAKYIAECEKNENAGEGHFSDYELEQQKQNNLKSGKGELTDVKYAIECEKNQKNGFGHFSDFELQTQRKNNEKKGKGLVTDSEVQEVNKKLYAEKVKPLVDKAKKYESEKRWCFALGAYYDALAVDVDPEVKLEVCDSYNELKNLILSGNPGKGKFNVFTIHDEWKKLLIDAEKYGSSIAKYELTIGDLVRGDLNYETKTATYSASVEGNISDRYERTIEIIEKGYTVAYKDDWSSDLPEPKNWPLTSVSYNKNSGYNVNGALIFDYYVVSVNIWTLDPIDYKNIYNAFAFGDDDNLVRHRSLFDYKFNIVDENGKELVKGTRLLLERNEEQAINFEGISPEVMDLIDNGKAFVKPVAVYLEYGKYNEADDKGGRSFIKNLPEVELDLNRAVFSGTNQKGDVMGKNVEMTFSLSKRLAFESELKKKRLAAEEKNIFSEFRFVEIPGQNYLMNATEITQKVYEAVIGENPSYFKREDNPVENVSWYDAIYFCNMLSEMQGKTPVYSVNKNNDVNTWEYKPHKGNSIYGSIEQNLSADGYRLPTEEEWEYAAKGGQSYKYAGSNDLDEVGWYEDNSGDMTHPVAQKKTNGYGLYDMSGNVWEWCWDVNPSYSWYRYHRGGSYRSRGNDCKVDRRYYDNADDQYNSLGFRIVCSASK